LLLPPHAQAPHVHRRALLDDDHQHAVVHVQAHVLEQPQLEQRADRRGTRLVAVGVAHAQGQRGEDGARLHPLQAFDADVAYREGLDGPRRRGGQGGGDRGCEAQPRESGPAEKRGWRGRRKDGDWDCGRAGETGDGERHAVMVANECG